MKTSTKLTRLAAAGALALSLSAAPVVGASAAEEPATEAEGTTTGESDAPPEGEHAEEEGGRIQVAETPRDRVGLLVLAFLGAVAVGGGMTAARQLRGSRPQADGQFRWR